MKTNDVRLIGPFAEAAFYVLQEVLSDPGLARENLGLKDNPHISHGVAAIIGLAGAVRGHVVFDMDKRTALEIASIMNGERMIGLDNYVRSTINELCNMIAGHAASKLTSVGLSCEITPPTFVVGENAEVYAHRGIDHLIVPFRTKAGPFTISVAIVEVRDGTPLQA